MARLTWTGVLLLAVMFVGAGEKNHGGSSWGYTGSGGPDHWSDLSEDYTDCRDGMSQSPINIVNATDAPGDPILVKTHYNKDPKATIENNGHTIQVNFEDGGHMVYVSGGSSKQKFQLKQFHFHHRSEHSLENKSYPMEVHLVHQGVDNTSELAVIGVFLDLGKANPFIEELWKNILKKPGKAKLPPINAASLLPSDQNIYVYSGSLTTPNCSETVSWNVYKTPITLSSEQVETFKSIFPFNRRPLQPLNGRSIHKGKAQ